MHDMSTIKALETALLDKQAQDRGLMMGRAASNVIGAPPGAYGAGLAGAVIQQASKPLTVADNLPPGEAFSRASVLRFIAQAVQDALQRDRQHREADGWIQRMRAADDCAEFFAEALEETQVPGDHRTPILDLAYSKMTKWVDRR